MENITDLEYNHAKRVCKDFEIENLSEYHDSYLKSDTLLLADIFESFRKICSKICQLHPAKFYFSPRISKTSCLEND